MGTTQYKQVSEEQAYTHAITAAKASGSAADYWVARGAYADWLVDHGRADEAESIHNELALEQRRGQLAAATNDSLWPRPDELEDVSDEQREIAASILTRPVVVLAGSAGTGKTTVASSIARAVGRKYGVADIAACAPFGKASVRLTQVLRSRHVHAEARTVHQMLEIGRNGRDGSGWGFQRNEDHPLDQRFVLLDEASTLETSLAASLFQAIRSGGHILLSGDPYQLAPVGHGAVLRDLMMSGAVPCGELRTVHRQQGRDNMILDAATAIRDNREFATCKQIDIEAGQNFRHLEIRDPDVAINTLVTVLRGFGTGRLGIDPIRDVQVMTATNEKGEPSRTAVNKRLQTELNPGRLPSRRHPFKAGDKIICRRNAGYNSTFAEPGARVGNGLVYVANGEIGRVTMAESNQFAARFEAPGRGIIVRLRGGRDGRDEEEDSDEDDGGKADKDEDVQAGGAKNFQLAYATTVHAMIGSEVPCAIYMVDSSPSGKRVSDRASVYTAITRAKRLCISMGSMESMRQYCVAANIDRRKTFLAEDLRGGTR